MAEQPNPEPRRNVALQRRTPLPLPNHLRRELRDLLSHFAQEPVAATEPPPPAPPTGAWWKIRQLCPEVPAWLSSAFAVFFKVFLSILSIMFFVWLSVLFVLVIMLPLFQPLVSSLTDDRAICPETHASGGQGAQIPTRTPMPIPTPTIVPTRIPSTPGVVETASGNPNWRANIEPLVGQMCADANAWRGRYIINYYSAGTLAVIGLVAAGFAQVGVALSWPRPINLLLQTSGTLALGLLALFPVSDRAEQWKRLYIGTETLVYEVQYAVHDEKTFELARGQYNALRQRSADQPLGLRASDVQAILTPAPTSSLTPQATAAPQTSPTPP